MKRLRRRRERRGRLELSAQARKVMTCAANLRHPIETGGALLGYRRRGSATLVVVDAIEIVDPGATSVSYAREQQATQDALDSVLPFHPHVVGYIGDWHSHPADVGPSPVDRSSAKRTARQYRHPLGLVVLSRHGDSYRIHGQVTHRGRALPTALVQKATNDAAGGAP